MLESGIELIELQHTVNYEPTFISTDKRVPAGTPTTLGYWQIGETQQYGFAKGPIFKVQFVDLSAVTATHIKIWGIDNRDDSAPIYPKTYFTNANYQNSVLHIYLKKFVFCNSEGVPASESSYTVVGYKKKGMLISW